MGTLKKLLDIAAEQIGIAESPPDSNNVLYNFWYYGKSVSGPAYPWCMTFVQWCFAQSGVPLPVKTASCGALARAATSNGQWVVCNFQPGDIVIYDFSGNKKSTQHCGIVEAVLPGYVQAVEGNTSTAGRQDNGGIVCRKKRADKYIIGAVRPVFEIEKEEDVMTGKEIYDALQNYLAQQPAPDWAQAELDEAVRLGVTDGKNPMQLVTRCQAAIMAKRAAGKEWSFLNG